MNNWIILSSFTYPHEAHIARAKLQSEGVQVRLRDEMTVQVHNFYSNAIGGVKLEVQENDYLKALEILKGSGIIGESISNEGSIAGRFNLFTSRLPYIGKSAVEIRLLIFVAMILLILSLIILPFIIMARPTVSELMISSTWCVNFIQYQDESYEPDTNPNFSYFIECRESVRFYENGTLSFPGFNSPAVNAKWRIENDKLIILRADTFKHVYEGEYAVKVNRNYLVMESANTIINCSSLSILW